MITQTLPVVHDDPISSLETWANCSRQICSARIEKLASQLERTHEDSSNHACCQARLDYAKRFFESEEYGSCEYELRVVELLIPEG